MAREIKFRAWDRTQHKYWNDVQGALNFQHRLDRPAGFAIEEYTGLTDENGQEIYEGDIVDLTAIAPFTGKHDDLYEFCGVVEMIDSSWVVNDKQRHMSIQIEQEELEPHIVGNIHENSELMEASHD